MDPGVVVNVTLRSCKKGMDPGVVVNVTLRSCKKSIPIKIPILIII
jgi:hypothetical protein